MPAVLIGNKSIKLPLLIPSISSFETQLTPEDAIAIQHIINEPASLVSAYDLHNGGQPFLDRCVRYRERGVLFVDSGGYETSRIRRYVPEGVSWSVNEFESVCRQNVADFVFSFDYFIEADEPYGAFWLRLLDDLRSHHDFLQRKEILIPVIHLQSQTGSRRLTNDEILDVVERISAELAPRFVAIPERELGDGILAKADLVKNIVRLISPRSVGLHILGCGNLLSFAALAQAGAQLFDGLEWCRTLVTKNFHLHHFQQGSLFNTPTNMAPNDAADYLLSRNLPYAEMTAIRNLRALQSFTIQLQQHLEAGSLSNFIERNFGKLAAKAIQAISR